MNLRAWRERCEKSGGAGLATVGHSMPSGQSRSPAGEVQYFQKSDHMNLKNWFFAFAHALFAGGVGLLTAGSLLAQVSPTEIANPQLRAAEQQFLPQLQSLHLAIGSTQFRLPFILTRYVGVDPARQSSLDTRGLEFVYFRDRLLLKTSGFYAAAFNSEELTSNERASRTFQEVIVPILRLIAEQIPPDVACDGIGFEIAYHVRAPSKNSDFEGREILAVVLDRADAFAFLSEPGNEQRQAILNRSRIYLDAKPFGLALGQKDALNLEILERSGPAEAGVAMSTFSTAGSRLPIAIPHYSPTAPSTPSHTALAGKGPASTGSLAPAVVEMKATASPADAEKLQAQYQSQLDTLLKDGAQFHLVDYAPLSFAIYHKQLVLQLTFRNPLAFEKSTSSIYKRAAQTFDLFLAPQLRALIAKLPLDHQFDALDFSILNRLGNEKDSSEAVEFICPLKSVRSFVEDEIASQDLIDQSLVLVNGVRINFHLELVE
jgi:hypothetical protein